MSKKKRGFTVVEVVVVMAMLAILAFIAIPKLISIIVRAQAAADMSSVKILNDVTANYRVLNGVETGDVFAGIDSDAARMQALVDAELLAAIPKPQEKDASFQWNIGTQSWGLVVAGEAVPSTALGSSYTRCG